MTQSCKAFELFSYTRLGSLKSYKNFNNFIIQKKELSLNIQKDISNLLEISDLLYCVFTDYTDNFFLENEDKFELYQSISGCGQPNTVSCSTNPNYIESFDVTFPFFNVKTLHSSGRFNGVFQITVTGPSGTNSTVIPCHELLPEPSEYLLERLGKFFQWYVSNCELGSE